MKGGIRGRIRGVPNGTEQTPERGHRKGTETYTARIALVGRKFVIRSQLPIMHLDMRTIGTERVSNILTDANITTSRIFSQLA